MTPDIFKIDDPSAPPLTWTDSVVEAAVMLGVVVAGTLLAWTLLALLGSLARRAVRRTGTTLDEKVFAALRPLARPAALTLALQVAPPAARSVLGRDAFSESLKPTLEPLLFVIWALLMAAAAIRLSAALMDWYTHDIAHRTESNVDEQILPFARKVVFVLVSAVAGVMILGRLGIDVSALVATLGVGSLAVALAAQSALADTISGVLIMLDRPFQVGDRIEILEIGTWGDVQDIGLRSTRIRTIDNRMVVVPNSVISKNLVVNYSHPSDMLRVETDVSVAYGTSLDDARRVLHDAVADQDWLAPGMPVEALFMSMGDSSLVFRVRCWIPHFAEAQRIKDKLNGRLYDALREGGIEIPFPQVVVHGVGAERAARDGSGDEVDAGTDLGRSVGERASEDGYGSNADG